MMAAVQIKHAKLMSFPDFKLYSEALAPLLLCF